MLNPSLSFEPSGVRANTAANKIRHRLAKSFEHIAEQSAKHIKIDQKKLNDLLVTFQNGKKLRAEIFAIYHEMLDAVALNNFEELQNLFSELTVGLFVADQISVNSFHPRDVGGRYFKRIQKFAVDDPDIKLDLVAPSKAAKAHFRNQADQALNLMQRATPGNMDEINALISEVIIASDRGLSSGAGFDGVSSFGLWGAIVLNADDHQSITDLAEVIVHETTHVLLFALSLDEALVRNPKSERFESPVRSDPRPMDGLFHGVYVLSRLHHFLTQLLKSDLLEDDAIERVRMKKSNFSDSFHSGIGVIRKHGDLSETGDKILKGAEEYMSRDKVSE
jgi:hypothetical protein